MKTVNSADLPGKRTALVIGNAQYAYAGSLRNPLNDVQAMSGALKSLGFTVTERINLDRAELENVINTWGKSLSQYDVALFYYAGHGIESGGINYLMPTDANPQNAGQVKFHGLPVENIIGWMDEGHVKTNIVLLDACRNNPLARSWNRSTSDGGLANMTAPSGTFIGFAASPGRTAADGDRQNGLYTEAVVKFLLTPNITIDQIFNRVNQYVRQQSNGTQIPFKNSSLEDDFFFARGTSPEPVPIEVVNNPSAKPAPAEPTIPIADANQIRRDIAQGVQAFESKEYKTAFKLLSQYNNYLDASGQVILASIYENGYGGITANKTEATRWYRRAAEQGNPISQVKMGMMYLKGQGGLTVDKAQAMQWYRKAAEQGNAEGQVYLGLMYYWGQLGNGAQHTEALPWFRKAAEQGNAMGQAYLGVMYDFGFGGVSVNKAEAVRWCRKAAEQGDPLGQTKMGMMYYKGEGGLAVDKAQAVMWYRKAADQGDSNGQAYLGEMYEKGEGGLSKDLIKAIQYYELAARKSNDFARKALTRLGKTW